jgi:CheY-like chemotaxis protein
MFTPQTAKILVAEDEPFHRQLAVYILQRLGYQVNTVTDGVEVVEALKQQPYDVIVMDVEMPKMNGLETTKYIRAEIPTERQPYIVALTAGIDRETCLAAGMDDFLEKPARKDELFRVLLEAAAHPQHQ